ncbi:MAG: type II secretion system protein [Armatimonadetes bacterium]|nr:type II secretion system protein [Armatimonadota bacterium]
MPPRSTCSDRGLTLLEMLVSAGLLLVLTAALFQVMVPMMQRADRTDSRQENFQRSVIFREFLTRRLPDAELSVSRARLSYYLPDTLDSPIGPLPEVSDSEKVELDRNRRYLLETVEVQGNVVIEERVDGDAASRRRLWNLGPEGSLEFDGSAIPLLRVQVRCTREGQPPWERELLLFLRP